jgi:hypothetical protein
LSQRNPAGSGQKTKETILSQVMPVAFTYTSTLNFIEPLLTTQRLHYIQSVQWTGGNQKAGAKHLVQSLL